MKPGKGCAAILTPPGERIANRLNRARSKKLQTFRISSREEQTYGGYERFPFSLPLNHQEDLVRDKKLITLVVLVIILT
ncbi:MAG: hypothetical protein ACRECZ_03455, partial [Methylocella sp.]